MKLKYKFKIDSPLDFWDIPARIYFMAATLFFLIPFYVIGLLTVKDDLPYRTGVVNGIHIGKDMIILIHSFYFLLNINSTTT